jgi:hypothetical protein
VECSLRKDREEVGTWQDGRNVTIIKVEGSRFLRCLADFLWGGTNEELKFHLVDWNMV